MIRSTLFGLFDDDQIVEDGEREAGLLVALLVKFPEIGALRVSPKESTLRLTFLLDGSAIVHQPFNEEDFHQRLTRSLDMLSRLAGEKRREIEIEFDHYDDLFVMHIIRELETLTYEEFPIILGVLAEYFGDMIIVDQEGHTPPFHEGDDLFLTHTFKHLSAAEAETLIGFRDGDRVLVFNEPVT